MNLNGLTEAEVQERLKDGRSNRGQEVKTKSKGQIIRENVLTLFNLLNLFLAIAIASVGSYKNLLFMTIVTANTVIGIVQELRSKKMVDKLSIMVSMAFSAAAFHERYTARSLSGLGLIVASTLAMAVFR